MGHSITLALSVLQVVKIPSALIELAIPVTILISAVFRWLQVERNENQVFVKDQKVYAVALFFGFIHGLGFSNMLRSLLGGGADILQPLLFFNLGLEVGQLLIVLFSLVCKCFHLIYSVVFAYNSTSISQCSKILKWIET